MLVLELAVGVTELEPGRAIDLVVFKVFNHQRVLGDELINVMLVNLGLSGTSATVDFVSIPSLELNLWLHQHHRSVVANIRLAFKIAP